MFFIHRCSNQSLLYNEIPIRILKIIINKVCWFRCGKLIEVQKEKQKAGNQEFNHVYEYFFKHHTNLQPGFLLINIYEYIFLPYLKGG